MNETMVMEEGSNNMVSIQLIVDVIDSSAWVESLFAKKNKWNVMDRAFQGSYWRQ